jgi:hypothetical protein
MAIPAPEIVKGLLAPFGIPFRKTQTPPRARPELASDPSPDHAGHHQSEDPQTTGRAESVVDGRLHLGVPPWAGLGSSANGKGLFH